jgi:putative DNA methylase
MSTVADSEQGRVYLPPTPEMESIALTAQASWKPDLAMPDNPRWFSPPLYGLKTFGDLFTSRQLITLTTFSDLVSEVRERVKYDAIQAGLAGGDTGLDEGGVGPLAYADAICVYMACVLDRMIYYGSSLTSWLPKDNALRDCMPRQALAMTWDFAECNPLGKSSGDIRTCSNSVSNYLDVATPFAEASARQCDAQTATGGKGFVFSTDPPYYDNIGYGDLSDFFYVWLRRALKPIFPDLFATLAVPKAEELVATPYRHGGKEKAEEFFLEGMTLAMQRLAEQAHPAFPVTIYYAFKQSESSDEEGTASTGWDTFLDAVIRAGFVITGTWPMRTEGAGRMIASGTNALASSIVLVCRKRPADAQIATRRDFISALKAELPDALRHLQRGNIAPVDLAQAAIGPGMALYSRYRSVLDANAHPVSVRDALTLINQSLDESLAEQEGDFDADTRWAVAWFDQLGFDAGEYGVAETLSKAKNTSVAGMVDAGIVLSKGGKVRLLRPDELSADWSPAIDQRLTSWEVVHQLVRVMDTGGESAAAKLVSELGGKAEPARELAYRLYTICERKKRAPQALSYNALVQSWPEIVRLAQETHTLPGIQAGLFGEEL